MTPAIPMNKDSYTERLDNLNNEKQARLEILSQNRKDLQTQLQGLSRLLQKP